MRILLKRDIKEQTVSPAGGGEDVNIGILYKIKNKNVIKGEKLCICAN